jgi:hypothetical protein
MPTLIPIFCLRGLELLKDMPYVREQIRKARMLKKPTGIFHPLNSQYPIIDVCKLDMFV